MNSLDNQERLEYTFFQAHFTCVWKLFWIQVRLGLRASEQTA